MVFSSLPWICMYHWQFGIVVNKQFKDNEFGQSRRFSNEFLCSTSTTEYISIQAFLPAWLGDRGGGCKGEIKFMAHWDGVCLQTNEIRARLWLPRSVPYSYDSQLPTPVCSYFLINITGSYKFATHYRHCIITHNPISLLAVQLWLHRYGWSLPLGNTLVNITVNCAR